jgi:hypothetical protein
VCVGCVCVCVCKLRNFTKRASLVFENLKPNSFLVGVNERNGGIWRTNLPHYIVSFFVFFLFLRLMFFFLHIKFLE